MIITADEGVRGGRPIPPANTDAAVKNCPDCKTVIVVRRAGGEINIKGRDIWYHDAMNTASTDCPAER